MEADKERLQGMQERGTLPLWVRRNEDVASVIMNKSELEAVDDGWKEEYKAQITSKEQLREFETISGKARNKTEFMAMLKNKATKGKSYYKLYERIIATVEESLYTTEQRANFVQLEKELGITRGKAKTFSEADAGKLNPKYKTGAYAYTHNCQCCSVTFEMRCRGFDVKAVKREKSGFTQLLAQKGNREFMFVEPKTGTTPKSTYYVASVLEGDVVNEMKNIMDKKGWYQISVTWKGGGGHRLCAINDGIKNYIYDPQTNIKWEIDDWVAKHNIGPLSLGILRTDNLNIYALPITKVVVPY